MKTKKRCLLALLLSMILTVVFIPTTAFGLDESDGWKVVPAGEIETIAVNEVKDTSISTVKDIITYKFIAEEEGYYVFFSKGELDTEGIVFDKEGYTSCNSNYGGEGGNFLIEFYADAGSTYYMQAAVESDTGYETTLGSLQLCVSKSIISSDAVNVTATKKYTYTGKNIKPVVKVTCEGKTLVKDKDYFVDCWDKEVGRSWFFVRGSLEYLGEHMVEFKVYPKKSVISKTAAGKKQLTVTMSSKVAKTGGDTYQIAYRQKGSTSWKYTTTKAQSKTIKSLKQGKQYQVKTRAYKKVDGTPYYGEWSAVKTTAKVK